MSWDLEALLIVVGFAGAAVLAPPLAYWVHRVRGWYRYRHLRSAYLPLDRSCPPWRANRRMQP